VSDETESSCTVPPIVYQSCYQFAPGELQYYGVRFTQDFGPFRRGEIHDELFVSWVTNTIKSQGVRCRICYGEVEAGLYLFTCRRIEQEVGCRE
jgi:hypothetical protein